MVEPAFAGVAQPSVTEALERCRRLGATRVAVVPFFLFTGVLVPRIYAEAAAYAAEHPELEVVAGAHLGPDRRLARLVLERYREALTGDVRMNCDLCTYRVRLPGYEDKVGTPISLTPHGDGPARGSRRARRATRAPVKLPPLRPAVVELGADDPGAGGARGTPTRTARRRSAACRCGSRRASGSRCSGPTARARRRSRWPPAARSRT